MSVVTRLRRTLKEARHHIRLPNSDNPVRKVGASVSRRVMMAGLAASIATAGTLPAPPKAQAAAWLRFKQAQEQAVTTALPQLQPLRLGQTATDGTGRTGTYNGQRGTGYSVATLAKFANQRGGDASMPKRGLPVATQPEQGHLGRVGPQSGTATDFLLEGIVATIFHCVSDAVTDGMLTQDKVIALEAISAALDGIAGGIASIEGYFENDAPVNVTTMTQGSIPSWVSGTKLHGLYQLMLKASALNIGEEGDAYFIAYSSMPGISPRVIGPYTFCRKAGYDSTALIDPSLPADDLSVPLNPKFKSLATCHSFYAANTTYPGAGANLWSGNKAAHVRVTFAQNFVLDFSDPNATAFTDYTLNQGVMGRRGRFVHDATGSNAKVQNNFGFVNADCKFMAIDWIGWLIDVANIQNWSGFYKYQSHFSTLNRCDITSSLGRDETPGTYGIGAKTERGAQLFSPNVLLVACRLEAFNPHDLYIAKTLGCKFANNAGDVCDIPGSLKDYSPDGVTPVCFAFMCVGHDISRISAIYDNGIGNIQNALKLTYSNGSHVGTFSIFGNDQGPSFKPLIRLGYTGANVPTADLTGSHGNRVPSAGGRTLTLRENGAVKQAFTFGQTYTFGGTTRTLYTFGDVIAAIGDWAAATGAAWTASVPAGVLRAVATADATATTSATLSGSIAANTAALSVTPGSLIGTPLVGQMVFTLDGVPLATIKTIASNLITLTANVVTTATSFGVAGAYTGDNNGSTVLLFSKAATPAAYSGDALGMTFASFTGQGTTVNGVTSIIVNNDIVGTIQPGAQVYRNDGSAGYAFFKSQASGGVAGGAGTWAVTTSASSPAGSGFTASTTIGYFDTRTLVLAVDGVPQKQFPAAYTPTIGNDNGWYWFENFKASSNKLIPPASEFWTPIAKDTQCVGLVGAINAWAAGNGWAASVTDPANNNALLPGAALLRMAEMRTQAAYASNVAGVAAPASPFAAQFSWVPLVDGQGATVYLMAGIGAHVDYAQVSNSNIDNALLSGNLCTGMDSQPTIWGSAYQSTAMFNMAQVNCGVQSTLDTIDNRAIQGQITSRLFHVVVVNCSFPTYTFKLRQGAGLNKPFMADQFCRIDSCLFDGLDVSKLRTSDSAEISGLDPTTFLGQIKRCVIVNRYGNTDLSDTGQPALGSPTQIAGNRYLYTAYPLWANQAARDGITNQLLGYQPLNLTNRAQLDFPGLATGLAPEFQAPNNVATVFDATSFKPAANGLMRQPANMNSPQHPFDANGFARDATPGATELAGCIAKAA